MIWKQEERKNEQEGESNKGNEGLRWQEYPEKVIEPGPGYRPKYIKIPYQRNTNVIVL